MDAQDLSRFDGVERVVADDLRFKLRLGIGEDAYASLRVGKRLSALWDVGGVAMTGASVAASAPVATTFFAGQGLLAALGFGAAAVTPVGWVAAAAVVTGGAYYGVTRLIAGYAGSRVQTIPLFINSPVDELGMSLLDLMGTLALKLAEVDGHVHLGERDAIADHFVRDWGFDAAYVARALDLLAANAGRISLRDAAGALSAFNRGNPDCNYAAMQAQLMRFLRDVAKADGVLDEREEMALEKVGSILADAAGLRGAVRGAADLLERAARAFGSLFGGRGAPSSGA